MHPGPLKNLAIPVVTLLGVLSQIPGAEVNLAAKYRPALDYAEGAGGQNWTSGKEDVWALKSFTYGFKGKFAVEVGPSQLVFGKQGTSVLWAALLPAKPGKLTKAPQGAGEEVTSIFLRFHPGLVGTLFPPGTVIGNGTPKSLIEARRIYQHKINATWQWDNLPVVPWKQALIFDCETAAGPRRFFAVDTQKGTVKYEPAFAERRLPALEFPGISGEESLAIFDSVWKAFDEEYAMFGLKKGVDWQALKDVYRPIAAEGRTAYEAAGAVSLLLAHLEDLHVWVKAKEEYLLGANRFRPLNASWKGTQKVLGGVTETDKDLAWARTKDGLGYVNIWALEKPELPGAFDEVLERLKDTKALIIDLRFNGGGGEDLALPIAGRFTDSPKVYSSSRYRNGGRHEQLTPKMERKFERRGPWRYDRPVAVLCGQKTMSSAESFVLMLAQCPQVTTLGDRTAGSSANPRRHEIQGVTVNLPRWLDLDPQGKPIDGVGVAPMVPVKASAKDFTADRDPVLEAALEFLRKGGGNRAVKKK